MDLFLPPAKSSLSVEFAILPYAPFSRLRLCNRAVRMLLEPIFEADFLSCSQGFRQGKSTHTALRDVAIGYSIASWIIEGDIEACYDNIPTGLLVKQIKRRIADEKVLQLIWRFLKAGYLMDWKYYT